MRIFCPAMVASVPSLLLTRPRPAVTGVPPVRRRTLDAEAILVPRPPRSGVSRPWARLPQRVIHVAGGYWPTSAARPSTEADAHRLAALRAPREAAGLVESLDSGQTSSQPSPTARNATCSV